MHIYMARASDWNQICVYAVINLDCKHIEEKTLIILIAKYKIKMFSSFWS